MSLFDDDALASVSGPDAVTASGPDGAVTGVLDVYDRESADFEAMPGWVRAVDRWTVFTIATATLGTIGEQSRLTIDEASYVVRAVRQVDDGRITELYLVAA